MDGESTPIVGIFGAQVGEQIPLIGAGAAIDEGSSASVRDMSETFAEANDMSSHPAGVLD